jgi:hypothetical protein
MSVADELKKMKELLDEGILSQEEFEAQKSKLLDSGSTEQESSSTQSVSFSEQITSVRPPHSQSKNWRNVVVSFENNKLSVQSTPEHSNDFVLDVGDILQYNYGAPKKGYSQTKPESTVGKYELFYKNRNKGSIDTAMFQIYSAAEEELLVPVTNYLNNELKDKGMSCPKCDSTNVQAARGKLGMVTLGVFFLPLAALAPKSKMKCKACGSRWQNPF